MNSEAGHAANRAYFDQNGELHLNGSNLHLDETSTALLGGSGGALGSNMPVTAGGGGATFKPEGNISVQLTQGGTGGDTNEDTLQTYSLPAGALDAVGRGLYIRAWGAYGANGNNKTVKLYFGSEAFNTGASAGNGVGWFAELYVYKTGANTQDVQGGGAVGTTHLGITHQTGAENDQGAITIKATGKNGTGSANDVVCNGMVVSFMN